MTTLTIKSIPDPLHRHLKERAAAHSRTLDSEVIVSLEQAIAVRGPDGTATLVKADALRATLRVPRLTAARLRASKATGRP
jgi:plasmid stability protein